jgi:hypothetical protein
MSRHPGPQGPDRPLTARSRPSGYDRGVNETPTSFRVVEETELLPAEPIRWSLQARWLAAILSGAVGTVLGWCVTSLTRFGLLMTPSDVADSRGAQIILITGAAGGLLIGAFASRLLQLARDGLIDTSESSSPGA